MNTLAELIGESAPMTTLRSNVERLLGRRSDARRMPPVLVLGETGTGKGLLAKLLHRCSARRDAPLVELNCAAIPETMLEAELFGYERGAFTDAREAKAGLLQTAKGGTLFLDEIGLLPLPLQGKLLKVIEEQSVRRLGSTRTEPIDVWIISATSDDLVGKARDGRFREDLYHRLAVISFSMPALRERGADVLILADRFLTDACRDYGLPRKRLAPAAEMALSAYAWPGNVRELANVMERVVLLFDGPVVSAEALALPSDDGGDESVDDEPEDASSSVSERRRVALLDALRATSWNITHTARRLMLSRNTVKARMRRYGLMSDSSLAARAAAGQRSAFMTPVETRPTTVVWESRRLTVLRVEIAQPEGADGWGADEVFGAVVAKLVLFGGRVEDVSPRLALVVFGLEVLDDAVRRAANAALATMRMLRDRAEGATATLAIHVAELLVARLAAGPAIDVHSKREAAALLDSLGGQAAANTVMVSGAAARFLSRRFELIPVGSNAQHTGPVFRLAGRERSGFVLFADGGNFVGRNDDLEVAQHRFGLAESGQGQVFAIVGEPGIGKSRLLYEFRRTLGDRGCRVLEAACPSHGGAFPFLPIVDIVRALFGLGDPDDARTVRETISRSADRFGRALAGDNLPAMLALLDALPADDPMRLLTPAQRRQRVEEAVCQLILDESVRQPLVLVVEDVQWIDSDSRAVLDALVDRLAGAPVMLVVTHRPEHRSSWSRKPFYHQVSLEALTPASVNTVLDELLGRDEVLGPLKDALVGRTEGNPFFVEETVRTLIESGALVGESGRYKLAARIDAIQVPPTVQAVLAERMDRLSVEDKRLLRAAVVVGGGGSVTTLAEVAELPPPSFRRALDQLHQARFLHEDGEAEDASIAFRHSLVQEVAYASLPADHRRALHLRCLTVLEAKSGTAAEEDVEQAAHHALHGEAWERASRYFQRAAARAVGRSAYRAAVSALNQGLIAIDKLAPTRETLALAIEARIDLRNMLWALGELSQGLGVLQDAVPLAEALGDQRRLARVFLHTSSNHWVLGENERALTMGQQAIELADRLDDFSVRIDVYQLLGLVHHSLGDYTDTVKFLERVRAELAASGRHGRFATYYNVHSRTWLAWTLAELGEFDRAATLAEEAVVAAEVSRDVHNMVAAMWGQGLVEVGRGEAKRALPMLRQAYETAQSAEMVLWARPAAAVLGRALALTGSVSDGRRHLEFVMKGGENNVGVAEWQTYLAETCLLAGDLPTAQTVIERALELAEKRKERGFLAHAHCVAAQVAHRRGHTESAREHYEAAMAIADRLRMLPVQARCELGLGQVCRGLGDPAGAERHATAARARFAALRISVPETH